VKPSEIDSHAAGVISVTTKRLSEILLETITSLASTGEVEAACRFAGHACVTLRRADPVTARHFDALLHRLTPRLKW
jgi:hypothetical protein